MMKKLHWFGLLILAAVFIAVFATVLNFRLSKGDIYPHYSTFRTDPLGSSALLESIQATDTVEASRNVEELDKTLGLNKDTTILLNGVPRIGFNWLDRSIFLEESELRKAVKEKGARLVLTIDPMNVPQSYDAWWEERKKVEDEKKGKEQEAKEIAKKTKKVAPAKGVIDVAADIFDPGFVGLSIASLEKFERPDDGWKVKLNKRARKHNLKQAPVWKSHLRFKLDDKAWKPIGTVDGKPVIVERKYGKGTIIATTDSFFTSNEALYTGGDSEFILFLIGNKNKLLFDETIHGTIDRPGVMEMVRRFRLQGIFVGVLIFLILWAWRTSNSLSPINESLDRGLIDSEGGVMGKGSNAGLISLLKKSVPGKELIHRCLAVWRSSQLVQLSPEKEEALNEIHRRYPEGSDPEEHYRKIAEVLKQR